MNWKWTLSFCVAMLFGTISNTACAAGPCENQEINQAYSALHLVPKGTGTKGECDPYRYGGDCRPYREFTWNSFENLKDYIVTSRYCDDPYIGQVYWFAYSIKPSAQLCNRSLYGDDPWLSYVDAVVRVKNYHDFKDPFHDDAFHRKVK